MGARAKAKAAGLNTYETGLPCKRGHIALRYTSTGNCSECLAIDGKANYNKDDRVEQAKAWRKANPNKRRQYTLKKYGLTFESFNKLLEKQNGQCAVCKATLELGQQTHIDHCHKTDKVRGLLCSKCNTAIGLLNDDPERAEALASYLRGFL